LKQFINPCYCGSGKKYKNAAAREFDKAKIKGKKEAQLKITAPLHFLLPDLLSGGSPIGKSTFIG